jgi:hypothetical protein
MLRKLWASALIVLGLLPFTAPFSTCDASALGDHRVDRRTSAALSSVPFEGGDATGAIVPPLLTRSGRLRIDVSPPRETASVPIAPSLSMVAWMSDRVGPQGRPDLPITPLQLRL